MLELINVSKYYESPADGEVCYVLKDISLELQPGQCVAVTGPSGSGKSTLLNIIGTLDGPSGGKVLLGDIDLAALTARITSERSIIVSMHIRSIPSVIKALSCRSKLADTSSGERSGWTSRSSATAPVAAAAACEVPDITKYSSPSWK